MKNSLKLNSVLILFLTTLLIGVSCTDQLVEEIEEQDDLTTGLFEGIELQINMTTTIKLGDQKLEDILAEVTDEIYKIEIPVTNSSNSRSQSNEIGFVGADVFIGGDEIIITPFEGTESADNTSSDTDECGGKKSDGWKYHKSCGSAKCVNEEFTKIGDATKLEEGQCLDLRVKRHTFSVSVCSRVTSC